MDPTWLSLLVLPIVGGLSAFLGAYLKRKGENLATREDVDRLTWQVKSIEQKFIEKTELLRSQLDARNQLRFVAAERRLQAHQDAFKLWRSLLRSYHSPTKGPRAAVDCDEWLESNCVFLGTDAYVAFRRAINNTYLYDQMRGTREATNTRENRFEEVTKAGDVILASVALPKLGEEDFKRWSMEDSTGDSPAPDGGA